MSPARPSGSPSWTPLQQGGSHGGGNQLFLVEEGGAPALLKVYRRRGTLLTEALQRVSQPFEGRRGVTAEERCALERETLALWRAHGLDVPRELDRPIPEGFDARTACWMEYCPGRVLSSVLRDGRVAIEDKIALVERLAAIAGRRHALAFEHGDVRFLVENASVKHVLVSDGRLVHFDLENAFGSRSDLVDALARELSTTLRSLRVHGMHHFELLATRFARAHPDPDLLRRAARHGAFSPDPRQRMRRWLDRFERKPGTAKADMLGWLAGALSAADGDAEDRPRPPEARAGARSQ